MKKIVMAAVCAAMAAVFAGCGGSPAGVAEKFTKAVILRDAAKAIKLCDTVGADEDAIKAAKEELDKVGKDQINDDKLDAEAIYEEIRIPAENAGYRIINGSKYTGETATVRVQFSKDKDKKPDGMEVRLVKVDGKWKVDDYKFRKGIFSTSAAK